MVSDMNNAPLPGDGGHPVQPRTSSDRIRDILALVTVIGFVLITAVMAIIFPLFALASPADMIGYLKDISSIYSGIIGVIIGYYFGKP